MGIIDCRYRPPTKAWLKSFIENPVYAAYMRATSFAGKSAKSLEECVKELEGLGVARAVLAGRDIESAWAAASSNPLVAEDTEKFPDLFIPVYGYDPGKGMLAFRELKDALARGKAYGASIEPGMTRLAADASLWYPLYALCCDFNAPVLITSGLSPRLKRVTLDAASPSRIDRVATDFPGLRILASHGCYPFVSEALGMCMRHDNVFLDFSSTFGKPMAEAYIKAAANALMDKFVFASASPFVDIKTALDQAMDMNFPAEAKRKIFELNAQRLFGNVAWRKNS